MNQLHKYKKALVLEPKLIKALNALEESEKLLKPYKFISTISDIFDIIDINRSIISIHLNIQRQIIKTKGNTP